MRSPFPGGRNEQAENAAPVATVRIAIPKTGDITRTLRVGGIVESDHTVVILSRITGQLTSVGVDIGDSVAAGEQVATIDDEQYRLTAAQAQVTYDYAQASFARIENLFHAGSTTPQNYDQAKSQRDMARSQLDLAMLQLNYTNISSPISGVVLRRHAQAGSLVGAQSPILTVATLGELAVNARIPESYYRAFASHSIKDVSISVPAIAGSGLSGAIDSVSPMVMPDSKTFDVKVLLAKAYGAGSSRAYVRPGMYVDLTFVLDRHTQVPLLPLDVLVAGNTLWYVDEDDTAHSAGLDGYFANDTIFEVPDTYRRARIIVDGQHFLSDGQRVNVLAGEDIAAVEGRQP